MIIDADEKNPLLESLNKNAFDDYIAATSTSTSSRSPDTIPIPMDVLTALGAELRDTHGKARSILLSISGITSVIASSIFIWMILRSHDRLSTTQHRLLLGLCISDIFFSLSCSTFNSHAPSDIEYFVWNARGNQASCTAQGFLSVLGSFGGLYYNASLNIYFLAAVKYNKSEEFIRRKIEPFLHGIPIVLALSNCIIRVVNDHFNADGNGICIWPMNDPPHCVGYDVGDIREEGGFDIPCFRGIKGFWTMNISGMMLFVIPLFIMMVSLGVIHRSVRVQEKKLGRYGVGALRSNLHQSAISHQQQQQQQQRQELSRWSRLGSSLTEFTTSVISGTRRFDIKAEEPLPTITRSNNTRSQSRAVMHKAFGYSCAWFLSYGAFLIAVTIEIVTSTHPLVLSYINAVSMPLQGLFNLLIFMYPKIMAAKKSKRRGEGAVTWRKAFVKAFWSRGKGGGKKKKNGPTRNITNLRGGSSHPTKIRNGNMADTASGMMKPPPKNSKNNNPKKNRAGYLHQKEEEEEEEEKCEIQIPDNMNMDPSKTKSPLSAASTASYAQNIAPFTESITESMSLGVIVEDSYYDEASVFNQAEGK